MQNILSVVVLYTSEQYVKRVFIWYKIFNVYLLGFTMVT